MVEILSMAEIQIRYAPDWVLIADPYVNDQLEVLSGKVVFHSPDRSEVWCKATELKLEKVAVRYLGEVPEHMVLSL